MNHRRKICVVTGARSEYGLLYWLMKAIEADSELRLQTVVTGMHLSPEFGSTYKQIESDGFTIDAKVESLLSSDSAVGVTKSTGVGVMGFADAFAALQPHIVLLMGDRYEMFAAAQAAMIARLPIAHIHGGETSEGAFDESIRHAITKMAQWHFVAAEPYRKRVIQMGEPPDHVFNHGAPGLDHLGKIRWLNREELEDDFGLRLSNPLFVVTYHPVTLAEEDPRIPMRELLAALERFPNATCIFTYPNADTGGRVLIEAIQQFVASQPHRAKAFATLGQQRYLSLMRIADVIVGNSSSGLIDAPALRKAAVNIGDRQKGRLRATSVIDSAERRDDIVAAIERALSADFRERAERTKSVYGEGNASGKIVATLKSLGLEVRKTFFDIDHDH